MALEHGDNGLSRLGITRGENGMVEWTVKF